MGMPLDFDLKHAVYGGAGAAIGAIMGYLLGFVLYIVVLSASAFGGAAFNYTTKSNPIAVMAGNSGLFPLIFAVAFAALGFFGGFYISSKASEQKPSA